METISQEELQDLKQQGYSEEQIAQAINQSEMEDVIDPQAMSKTSSFMTQKDENLIRWQLELNDILERAEHILRGDVPKYVNGTLIWVDNPYPDQNPLSEWGVQEVMKILAMYINRNTILSDYNNDEINWKVYDFGRRLNNLFFMRYDELGMDNEQKRKNYEILVGEMVDLVHSAYKRALHGGERRSLREMISVQQSHQSSGFQSIGPDGYPQPKERGILNPMRAIKGKYVG